MIVQFGPSTVLAARSAKLRGAQQKKGELRPLIAFLKRRRLQIVVEIGTYRGGTLWLWCRLAAPDAKIVSIDLPGGQFGGGYAAESIGELQSFARARQELVLVRADSHAKETLDQLVATLDGRTIDFLFIDGDHSYAGVKQDFEMYTPLVGRSGIVALHDILPHPSEPTCEVDQFWDGLKQSRKVLEFVDRAPASGRAQWGGIGVVLPD